MPEPASPRLRQPWLIPAAGPMTARLGAEFFAMVPRLPGVYFFYDETGRLLYIGQSSNLHARIGSYRFVQAGRHSRRTARMVFRVHRIEWQICESSEAAIAMEASLLLERRPPFNRAGVWMPPPCKVVFEEHDNDLHATLTRQANGEIAADGSLPSAFRFTFASLMRWTWRWHHPDVRLWELPCGMAGPLIPPCQIIPLSENSFVCSASLTDFAATGNPAFLEQLAAPFADGMAENPESVFWNEELENLRKFSARVRALKAG